MTAWNGGNPNAGADTGGGGSPEKPCPICGEEYGSVPDHIRRDH